MRFGMGNHNSALLEAASIGDLRKAKQLLAKSGAAEVNRMGQVFFSNFYNSCFR